ncbi:TetR/AcrR family transcriptional regulator C-terminal domain-containing protein [Streptomyces sp. NPDC004647]|uniref:TetR/AcrR family transcriptional regulator n=1 Tax=Streptomyces sp. NPDC004647 TaxID=3154671 RepID=UPI0033B8A3F3
MAAADRTKDPVRTSVWLEGRPAPRRRSEQPAGLDRDKIVAATVRLLDSEGLAKFSMRRLAAELGVTAMSVYWYVDTKDDLLELALDSVTGEIPLPEENEAADWRDSLRLLAAAYRNLLVTHPWVSRLMGEYLNVGPQAMAFATAAQRVVRASGLTPEQLPGAMALVYQFAYGFGTIEGGFTARCQEAGISQDDFLRRVTGAIEDRPEFEESRDMVGARGDSTVEEMRTRDFDIALDCAIAGIEAMRGRTAGS